MGTGAFQTEAFELLRGLHFNPHASYYYEHKADLKEFIERPLHGIMARGAERLPDLMKSRLEMKRNVFSRFLKNDFGNGGAWDNYWGAFYPKGSRRIMDAQLAVWMDPHRVQISYYINDLGKVPRQRFLRNMARYREELPVLLSDLIRNERVVLAYGGRTRVDPHGRIYAEKKMSWEDWLDHTEQGDYLLGVPFTPQEAVTMPENEWVDWVVRMFNAYFPLALMAMEEEPLAITKAFMGFEKG